MSTVEGAVRHESWERLGVCEVLDADTGIKWVWRARLDADGAALRGGWWVGLREGECAPARSYFADWRTRWQSSSLPPPGAVR